MTSSSTDACIPRNLGSDRRVTVYCRVPVLLLRYRALRNLNSPMCRLSRCARLLQEREEVRFCGRADKTAFVWRLNCEFRYYRAVTLSATALQQRTQCLAELEAEKYYIHWPNGIINPASFSPTASWPSCCYSSSFMCCFLFWSYVWTTVTCLYIVE